MKSYLRFFSCAALIGLLVMPAAHAGAIDRLQAFYKQVQSLRGEFTQTVYDDHMKVKKRAEGSFAIRRPGRFHWDYEKPYRQLIVSDGAQVWIYDSDLEQVTVKKLDEAVGGTPAQLLSSRADLERDFTLVDAGSADGLQWVALTPHDTQAGFEEIRLGFDERDLRSMELKDNFGQTTRLEFSHLQRNPALPDALFHFTPPPGVDVIGE
jgi:outer membrane lipoprotein carrier protein